MKRATPLLVLAGIIAVLVSPIGPPVLRVLREMAWAWWEFAVAWFFGWLSVVVMFSLLGAACTLIAGLVLVAAMIKETWHRRREAARR